MSQMTVILLAYILTCSGEVWEIIHSYLGTGKEDHVLF